MTNPDCMFQRCLDLIRRNRLDEADFLASTGIEYFPEDGNLWQARGLIRHRLRSYELAGEDLETASMLVPLGASAQCALADCHFRNNKPELALGLYRHLANDANCPSGLLPSVASGLGGLKDFQTALSVCRTLLSRDSSRHEAHFGIAYYLRKLGHSRDEIFPHVSSAHELSPKTPLYRVTLATLLDQSGRRDEARELLRDLGPEAVSCPCCLKRIASIFQTSSDPQDPQAN